VRRLPQTRKQVCAGVWSLCLILAAVVCVGGLTYWLPTKSHVRRARDGFTMKRPAKVEEDDDEDDSAKKKDRADAEQPAPEAAPQETTLCVIVGYTTDQGGLTNLVLATVKEDMLYYAGLVPVDLPPDQQTALHRQLAALPRTSPAFPSLEIKARWVRPVLTCEVQHLGMDGDGLLKEPQLKELVRDASAPGARLARCVIVGYTLDNGELTGLVLGQERDGKLRYAGTVRAGLTAKLKKDLREQLAPLESATPTFPDLAMQARWVRPALFCDVDHAGRGPDGLLRQARLRRLLGG
jgi:ATP-dependent DNA ligase